MRASTLEEYADKWLGLIDHADTVCAAKDLYGGVGHQAVLHASELTGAALKFVSAGLGLVDSDEAVPSYDLTVSPGGPGPFGVLNIPYQPDRWWMALHHRLTAPPPLSTIVSKHTDLVILALPSNYLQMLWADLEAIPARHLKKLRIITTAQATLPTRCQDQAILYDARLSGVKGGYGGAMTSLVQRAALHFMSTALADRRTLTVESQRRRVDIALASVPVVIRSPRRVVDDASVVKAIEKMSHSEKSSFSTALNVLRHRKNIACEQSRFKELYRKAMHDET